MAMNNIYLFIGFDSTGKSEIAKNLASLFDWTYFKNRKNEIAKFSSIDGESKLAFKYETQMLLSFLQQLPYSNSIVLDRSIPCEYAYSKTLNRDFDEDVVWYFDEEFAKLDAKIIYCHKSKIENFQDEYIKIEQKEQIEKFYEEYLAKTKMKYVKVDTTSEDLVEEFAQIFRSGIIFNDFDEEKEVTNE